VTGSAGSLLVRRKAAEARGLPHSQDASRGAVAPGVPHRLWSAAILIPFYELTKNRNPVCKPVDLRNLVGA